MRHFNEILQIAEQRHGGIGNLEAQIPSPKSNIELAAISGDRWLSDITKNVFRAGFNRKIINDRWPGFESAFGHFDLNKCAAMDDTWLDTLLKDTRIVRNGARIRSVQNNAIFVLEKIKEHGSFGAFLTSYGTHQFGELMEKLHKEGSRLGDKTAQYMLREAGVDGYILSFDVVKRLKIEGVASGIPTSKAQRHNIQSAFDMWLAQSGKTLTYVSRVLALSVDSDHVYRFGS